MNDSLKILGNLKITLLDKDGKVKEERLLKNLVVDSGLEYLVHALGYANNGSPFAYVALGTGTSSPSAGNTTLQTELTRGTIGSYTFGITAWTVAAGFNPGVGTGTITEAGIFNASSGGTMLSRTTFTPIVKHSTDSLLVTWTINFASS